MRTGIAPILLGRLSIQQRLSLLICSLLLICIAVYGFANYYSLKKADLAVGRERLHLVTTQMNASFGQVTAAYIAGARSLRGNKYLTGFLTSGGKRYRDESLAAINKLKSDTTWVQVELLDKNYLPVLISGNGLKNTNLDRRQIVGASKLKPDSPRITKLYKVNQTAYYPLISPVSDDGRMIGYVIAWKAILTSRKAVAQFSQFIGMGANFFVGNQDGSIWTDFINIVPIPSIKQGLHPGQTEFTDNNEGHVYADLQAIPNTRLLFGIAVSENNMLAGADRFITWIVVLGLVILIIGIMAAWVMSRAITRPLNDLINIATAIAQGNYSQKVPVERLNNDEIGKLAGVFNLMVAQVSASHHELESRVEERTHQLASANRELEAFSYSVSHDLRAPLRAISGYSIMLREDYESELDSEGRRIVKNIISNAKMMGQLIDDLLAFSRLGKKELTETTIDMQKLAGKAVEELLSHEPPGKYQIVTRNLPPARGDEMMMKQVLLNLLGNAIKYSSKKALPEIEIGAVDEDRRIVYYVRDNGAGFNMAYRGKLFGVFQRLHSAEDFEGSGVGLALVKRIIEKHNGEVWAEGIEGGGATFYFSLPKF